MSLATRTNHEVSTETNDKTIFNALKDALYPGASDENVMMILNYCKARKIDPMLKPVHLVGMSVKIKDKNGKNQYEWRDVVMPGIGLYRIDAARSGQYAGMDEPEYGDDVTETIGNTQITYPKWCKITVKKIVNGQVFSFTAKEFWKENYATKSKDDISPNAMWYKRPYGQIAKCAEAQALRKAFPDVVGNEYTHEEMEGKIFKETQDETRKPTPFTAKIIEAQKEPEFDMKQIESDFNDFSEAIKQCVDEEQLRTVFTTIKSMNFKARPDLFKELINLKDAKKEEILVKAFNAELDREVQNETV